MKRYTIGLITLLLIVGCEKKNGTYTTLWENGEEKTEENWKDGKKIGVWTEWNNSGQLLQELTYNDGVVSKILTISYNRRVRIRGEVQFEDDTSNVENWKVVINNGVETRIKDGQSLYWKDSGEKWEENWKDGGKNGKWTEWIEGYDSPSNNHPHLSTQSITKYEGYWKDGKKDGKWTKKYFKSVRSMTEKKVPTLLVKENWKDGKEDGLWTWWYMNGQKERERTYKDGKEDGLWTGWYENGKKVWERTYKDGKEDGLQTDWYYNRQKSSERIYKNGKEDGLWTTWYENGKKKVEGTSKDGIMDGLRTGWYSNGQKAYERTYKDGTLDGLWTKWYSNGQKKEEGTYKDGNLISEKH